MNLLSRLEQATEGSRELDALIWATADPIGFQRRCSFKGRMYAGHIHTKAEKAAHIKRVSEYEAPHYTTSLDAKLPWETAEGAYWEISGPDHGGEWTAYFEYKDGHARVTAKTETLARRIAALRARGVK